MHTPEKLPAGKVGTGAGAAKAPRPSAMSPAAAARGPMTPAAVLTLQRAVGHQAVSRALGRDAHVHGADCGHGAVQRRATAETAESAEAPSEILNAAMASASRPIEGGTLKKAQSFYQNDRLSRGRVHTGPLAQRAVAAFGAKAMTVGEHVFFGAGVERDTATAFHEYGHLDKNTRGIAETGTDNGTGAPVTNPNQGSEREAASDGAAAAGGAEVAPSVVAQRAVDRSAAAGAGAGEAVQRVVDPHPAVQRAPGHGSSRSSSRGSAGSRGSSSGEEREYKKHIGAEVDRLLDQYRPWIPLYLTRYHTWLSQISQPNNWKYIAENAAENDTFAILDGYLGDPDGRGEAEIVHDLKKALRHDLKQTSKETMGHSRSASQNAKGKLVLGRKKDTDKWGDYQKEKDEGPSTLPLEDRLNRKLNSGKWSIPVNYAWVEGGVEQRAIFKIVSRLRGPVESALRHGAIRTAQDLFTLAAQEKDPAIYDPRKTEEEGGPETMLGHELLQLIRAGYTFTSRASTYGLSARLIAVPPGGHAADDKRIPLLEM
jgi:uncharacterized protein DUF4157